jgi:hypothetical protein
VLGTSPMPRERFNERDNTVELIDRNSGKLIREHPGDRRLPNLWSCPGRHEQARPALRVVDPQSR